VLERTAGQGVGDWAKLCRTEIAVGSAGQHRDMSTGWCEDADQG